MTMYRLGAALALAAGLFVIAACADAPEWEIRRARAAVKDLKETVRADRWAPREYESVEEALKAAERELAAQKARWSPSRDYTRTAVLFGAIPEEAAIARRAAETGRKAAEAEANEALDAALVAITHARSALMVVPVGDGGGAARRIGDEIEAAEHRIEEVRSLLLAEEFAEAAQRSAEILEQVNATLRRLALSARH